MTVAMALVEKLHHSAQRPEMVRVVVWRHELNCTATIQDPSAHQPELFSLEEEPGGGAAGPAVLGERGLTGSSMSGRRNGISGAPWNRSSTTRSS